MAADGKCPSAPDVGKMKVQQDIIYIPSISKNAIKTYTPTGTPAGRDINIKLSKTSTSTCVVPSDCLVVTQESPSLVVCIKLKTRKGIWNLDGLNCPQGITCDRKSGHLLIYTKGISALNTPTVAVVDCASDEFFFYILCQSC
jgi:hypothetical protein